jgi:hypothetical protein
MYKPNAKERLNCVISKNKIYTLCERGAVICIVMYSELVQLGVVSLCAVPDAWVQGCCTFYNALAKSGCRLEALNTHPGGVVEIP